MNADDWRRVEEYFHAAAARAPDARRAFLDEVCRDQPGLRRHVDDLLAWDARAEAFLSEPAVHVVLRRAPRA